MDFCWNVRSTDGCKKPLEAHDRAQPNRSIKFLLLSFGLAGKEYAQAGDEEQVYELV